MTGTTIYTDEDGTRLQAKSYIAGAGITVFIENGRAVEVDADGLLDIITALYREAGQEPPVMLGRPVIDPASVTEFLPFRVLLDRGEVVLGQVGSVEEAGMAPSTARQLAALIAAYADAARPEPDPAEVEELVRALGDSGYLTGDTAGLARAVLCAGYRREARDG